MKNAGIAAGLAGLVAASACAPAGDAGGGAPDLPVFTVVVAPSWVLADDGSEERGFTSATARRLPDGSVVVGDRQGRTIRVFDRERGLRTTLARPGRGPGELEGPFVLTSREDTVFAFVQSSPMAAPEVHVFVAGEGFVTRFRPASDDAPVLMAIDRLSTGQYLVRRGTGVRAFSTPPEPGRVEADTVTFGLYSPAAVGTASVQWLPPVLAHWFFTHPWPDGPMPAAMAPFPFGPTVSMVVSADQVWRIDGGPGRVTALDGSGREVVTARLPLTALRPSSADFADLEARQLDAAERPLDRARIEALFDPALRPATMPIAAGGYAGAGGEVWVRRFDPDPAALQQFVIVDRDGASVAQAELPAGVEVQHIGVDFVLGVRRDSLGVESVVEFALTRDPVAGR